MGYREQEKGSTATFLIPAAKLSHRGVGVSTLEQRLHEFLLAHFGGYTTPATNLHGYWVSPSGESLYGEHREYRVFLNGAEAALALKTFLAEIASQIEEQCICFAEGRDSCLIFPRGPEIERCAK